MEKDLCAIPFIYISAFIHSFGHSFGKYVLGSCDVPGLVLGPGSSGVTGTEEAPTFLELASTFPSSGPAFYEHPS